MYCVNVNIKIALPLFLWYPNYVFTCALTVTEAGWAISNKQLCYCARSNHGGATVVKYDIQLWKQQTDVPGQIMEEVDFVKIQICWDSNQKTIEMEPLKFVCFDSGCQCTSGSDVTMVHFPPVLFLWHQRVDKRPSGSILSKYWYSQIRNAVQFTRWTGPGH